MLVLTITVQSQIVRCVQWFGLPHQKSKPVMNVKVDTHYIMKHVLLKNNKIVWNKILRNALSANWDIIGKMDHVKNSLEFSKWH